MIIGLTNMFESMGKPKQLYSDEESSMRSSKMNRCLNDNEVKSIQTTTHAHTAERAIRTFRLILYRRLDALKQEENECIKHISSNIKKHNSTEHNITKIKPNEAGKKENHLWVNWHLQNASKRNRKYPEISKGDMVRFKIKPSIGTKGHEAKWSSTTHEVTRNPEDNQYVMPSIYVEHRKSKMWLRHELMKV